MCPFLDFNGNKVIKHYHLTNLTPYTIASFHTKIDASLHSFGSNLGFSLNLRLAMAKWPDQMCTDWTGLSSEIIASDF